MKKSFSKDEKHDILLGKKNWERKGVLSKAGSTFFLTVNRQKQKFSLPAGKGDKNVRTGNGYLWN